MAFSRCKKPRKLRGETESLSEVAGKEAFPSALPRGPSAPKATAGGLPRRNSQGIVRTAVISQYYVRARETVL